MMVWVCWTGCEWENDNIEKIVDSEEKDEAWRVVRDAELGGLGVAGWSLWEVV